MTWNRTAAVVRSWRSPRVWAWAVIVGLTSTGGAAAYADSGPVGAVVSTVNSTVNSAVNSAAAVVQSVGTATPAAAGPTTSTPASNAPLALAGVEQAIGADQSWAAGAMGQGVDVAVLDTGVTPVPGLNAPNKVIYGPDLSFDSQDPTRAYLDGYGHGTAMASLVAGNDGTPGGFTGIAPAARIVSVKVGASNGTVDVSQIIAGIDWVVAHRNDPGMNIRVLSLSLGTDSQQPYVLDPLAHAAEVAWRHGIVVVAAAGNNGLSQLSDPADDPYLLSVGAADNVGTVSQSDDVLTDFSSVGTPNRHATLVAPGAYIVSLRDPGSTLDQQFPNARIGDRFFRGSGTSEATAITAGAVADLLSANPSLSPDQVKQLLTSNASRIATHGWVVGAGELNLAAAEQARTPGARQAQQRWFPSNGLGSLEAARGSNHVQIGGVVLTGEQDIFGQPWGNNIAYAEENENAWNGGTFNGVTWSGVTWSGVTWSGVTWSGVTWSGVTWSGVTWSGVTWSGVTWSGVTWSGVTWSGVTWSGVTWSGNNWSGNNWSGVTWSGSTWA